jgi:dTDP-4-dehydrorhamnose reductase
MLGNALWRTSRERAETHATVRAASLDAVGLPLEEAPQVVSGVRAEAPETVENALDLAQPEVVVNCVGIVKQSDAARDAAGMVHVNSLFPHVLAAACALRRVRLIHVSTDCVFSGNRGAYRESDNPDPVDLYGRSKLAGEPSGPHVLTVRASMIGWELAGRRRGLLEWFVAQRGGTVRGYTRAVFTGPTAPELSRAILALIERRPDLSGTWHVAGDPITKHELLLTLRAALGLDVDIVPDDGVAIDRSLNGSQFRAVAGWAAPSWQHMVTELAAEAPARALEETVARR